MTAQVVEGRINDRWGLWLTPDRVAFHAARPGWEAERLASMFSELSPGGFVVDVGAECGDFTALYGTWGLEVAAIEPAAAYWPAIRVHLEANGVEPEWCFEGFASAPEQATQVLVVVGGGAWPQTSDGPVIPDAGFAHLCHRGEHQAATLDTLVGENGPCDAVTIDVEGAEYRVLDGARQVLEAHRPLVWVAIHTDARWMAEQYPGEGRDAVERLLAEHEYDVVELADSHETHLLATPR